MDLFGMPSLVALNSPSDTSSEMSELSDVPPDLVHFDLSRIDPSFYVFDLLGMPPEMVERVFMHYVQEVGIVEAWEIRDICGQYPNYCLLGVGYTDSSSFS
jgi:hypothetical protein